MLHHQSKELEQLLQDLETKEERERNFLRSHGPWLKDQQQRLLDEQESSNSGTISTNSVKYQS